MDIATIVTLFGVFLAVYALLPRYRRLELPLRIRRLDAIIIAMAFVLVNLLSFTEVFGDSLKSLKMQSEHASYAVILLATVILYFRISRFKLRSRQVSRFCALAKELLDARQYHELLVLLERHICTLMRLLYCEGRFVSMISRLEHQVASRWGTKGTEELARCLSAGAEGEKASGEEAQTRWRKERFFVHRLSLVTTGVKRLLSRWTSADKLRDQIGHLFERCFTSQSFVKQLVLERPYMALNVFKTDRFLRDRFLNLFFEALFKDTNSIIYFEIAQSQSYTTYNSERRCAYDLDPSNRLIYHLFNDVRNAEKLEVWRPVGERMLAALNELRRAPSSDPYLRAVNKCDRKQLISLELFAGLHFFDLMVTAAIWQGVTYHMWLHYLPYLVEAICANVSCNAKLGAFDESEETIYDYLLNRILDALSSWAASVVDLKEGNANKVFKKDGRLQPSIVGASIKAFGNCMRYVLLDDRLRDQVKQNALENALVLYRRLCEERFSDYAAFLLQIVRAPLILPSEMKQTYEGALAQYVRTLDDYNYTVHEYTRTIFDTFVKAMTD